MFRWIFGILALAGAVCAEPPPVPLLFPAPPPPSKVAMMPQLVGLSQSEAESTLARLKVEQVQIIPLAGGEVGRVVQQHPAQGQATRMAYLYVGSPPVVRESREVKPVPQNTPKPVGLSRTSLFALGQVTLFAFAWVAWVRIEEQARSRPLHPQAKGQR